MLELKNIQKEYHMGGEAIHALKGISLCFRKSEFVAVLGPSGCGKTTMLNIIGGLDGYNSGELLIGGRSTKGFRARDWDAYRNHSIGFVFQSYNLIPHQTVLQNVELALTLSGVSKRERRARAKQALEEVGLGNQLRKKPSQMSGGQMQRVAIARAIVNDPEIVLADEPTGALDTETSVQVMDILKRIAQKRLVIMVTHNPELAEKYATRTVRMLDGLITEDSAPLTEEELKEEAEVPAAPRGKAAKKPSMSFATAFGLSLKNLFTKKGRTALTAFAGSIGIIGISLIFAVSQGMTSYINALQEDTLSSYPITLEAQTMDLGSLMTSFIGAAHAGKEHPRDKVYEKSMVYDMVNALNSSTETKNDLASFKKYLEEELEKTDEEGEKSELAQAVSGVQYTYDADLLVYTESVDDQILRCDPQALMQELLLEYFGMDMSSMLGMSEEYGMGMETMNAFMPMGSSMILWEELLPAMDGGPVNPLLTKQYDLICGSWPREYNEIVLVVDDNNEIDDITLYALGLKPEEDIDALMQAVRDKTKAEKKEENWSYEEICGMEFRTILSSDCYALDETTGCYTDLRDTKAGLRYLYDNGLSLKVSGIIRPNEEAASSMLSGSIGYTHELTEYLMEKAKDSETVKAQQDSPDTDIFTGLPFRDAAETADEASKAADFISHIDALDEQGKADAYLTIKSLPDEEQVEEAKKEQLGSMTRADMEETLLTGITQQAGMNEENIKEYLASMSDEDLEELFTQMWEEQYYARYSAGVREQMAALTTQQLAGALAQELPEYTDAQCARYYDEVLEFSESDYDANLLTLGYVDPESPASINLYAATFGSKGIIEESITAYNDTVEDLKKIEYTDYVGLMMSSVTSIIDAITYVLIAFVAVSLIVSSIMIGVITLISVQERTKEIGILRAIGASKRNVSSMFNAETIIIGFISGLLGVLVTYLLCIPINRLMYHFTGIAGLNAFLPVPVAVALVLISILLTLISGIIPSRSAAKKDPVVALRTE